MNFFHKKRGVYSNLTHHTFWEQTEYGAKSAKSYDSLDKQNPDHLNSFDNFLNTFSEENQKIPTSFILRNGVLSKINENAIVNQNQCVVSLTDKKNHAVLVIESLDSKGLRMDWFDFIVKNEPHTHKPISDKLNRLSFGVLAAPKIFINKRLTGMVRYCPTNNGQALVNIPSDMTKTELFSKLNWNPKTVSWVVPVENIKTMLQDIRSDYDRAETGKLNFKFCGHTAPRHFASPDEVLANCKTWAISKLQKANVDVAIDLHSLTNKIVANKIVIGH